MSVLVFNYIQDTTANIFTHIQKYTTGKIYLTHKICNNIFKKTFKKPYLPSELNYLFLWAIFGDVARANTFINSNIIFCLSYNRVIMYFWIWDERICNSKITQYVHEFP